MTNGKRLKPSVIYWWEEGQPPSTTEELEALLQVMRTHGLSSPEVDQFRTAVFAACLDRQYPGLAGDEELCHRRDIAEVIEHRLWPCRWSSPADWPISIVQSVGLMVDLERSAGVGRTRQAIAQQQALAMMRAMPVGTHERAGRSPLLRADLHARSCAALRAHPQAQRPDRRLTPLYLESLEAYLRAHAPLRSSRWAHRLLELSDEAAAEGKGEQSEKGIHPQDLSLC
jgi:hypothetical protein